MRISRPCYDKMHRCPSWAGGGGRYARVNRCKCGGGTMPDFWKHYDRRLWRWRPYYNRACGVLVLPYAVRYLAPIWWRWKIRCWAQDINYWWKDTHR